MTLKPVICPTGVVKEFLVRSMTNTNNKIETCGILGGIEKDGKLIVNTLVIPNQTG